MSGISGIFILNNKGLVIIQRMYRSDLDSMVVDQFNKLLIELDEFSQRPFIFDSKTNNTFIYTVHNNLTFLAITTKNTNIMMVFQFLYSLIDLLIYYFKELEEESVRDNFVVIYELLDEIIDNGFPQTTDSKILMDFIKMDSHQLIRSKKEENLSRFATISTSAITWRPEGIKHKKNELYLDVHEKLNMLVNKQGKVIEAEIIGTVQANSMLSGTPDCKLCINDKEYYESQGITSQSKNISFEDMKFHQCVRLSKFQNERVISFIPPDGIFELISYRIPVTIAPLFSVDVIFNQIQNTRIEVMAKIKSNYKDKSTAHYVIVYIPVPEDAQKAEFSHQFGTAVWASEKESIKWSFSNFEGQKEYIMSCKFNLPSVCSEKRMEFKNKPICVEFEIPFYTVSGFQVRYMKIEEKSGYEPKTWVRYLTKNQQYQIRMK